MIFVAPATAPTTGTATATVTASITTAVGCWLLITVAAVVPAVRFFIFICSQIRALHLLS